LYIYAPFAGVSFFYLHFFPLSPFFMKHIFTTRLLACLTFLALLWPQASSAAPFTPGNLVVVRVGDGAAALSSAATAAFLDEYTPTGTLVQSLPLPVADAGANQTLTTTGSSSSDAHLTRSVNGAYLVFTGYDAAPGTAAVAGTTAAAVNRIVGRIAADGSINTTTRIDDAFSAGNFRSAATVDGQNFYGVGSVSGVRYIPFGATGATTAISTGTPTNLRVVNIAGGDLYVTSASGTTFGVAQVGSGLPTTSGQAITLLPGFPTATASPYGFYFADLSTTVAGVDVVYVADDRTTGGIQKYSLVAGTWTLNGTIGGSTTATLRGLTGSVSGTTVSLGASGGGGLYFVSDNAGYNVAPSTAALPAPVATAATNTAFRGVAFSPVALATPAPTVTSFTPASGAVGATVTITGTNFTGATAVTLNGVAITGFTVVNATTITFVVPTGATSGNIAVTTPGGTATSATGFTVTAAPAPTITSFTPASGPTGTSVTITGTNFTGATAVTVGGIAATYTVVNATTITLTVPATATTGAIVVTTPGGTVTSATNFTVTTATPAPTITSFTPASGAVGATVTVTGTNFTGASVVTLNGVVVSGFTVVNATTITFTVPTGAASGAIAVTTPGGTATSATSFTVTVPTPAPTITSFTPASGAVGATVTITGTNFTGATAVTLNGVAITGFTVVNATTITFTVPTGATSGNIAVTTPGGTATSATGFTVTPAVAPPTITSFSPARAIAGQGFTLVVNGTNLVAGTTITFNGNTYTGTILGSSGTGYTVIIPASGVPGVGTYNITATNPGGSSAPLSFLVVAPATTVSYEDFEQGTKGGYATGTVALRSGSWTMTDALLGNQFNDKTNQVQSARIRGGGTIFMNFDKPNGAGTITINAALYGADTGASFTLDISTNGGTTYTPVAGAPATLTATLTPYTFTVNQAGNVRLRINSTNLTAGSNPRVNIDDINITDFIGSATLPGQAMPGLALYPNPAQDRLTVLLPGTGAAQVALRDLTGRIVLPLASLPADHQLRLPASLAAGVYLLEVRQGSETAVRRVTKE
jgi:hypothetical protein